MFSVVVRNFNYCVYRFVVYVYDFDYGNVCIVQYCFGCICMFQFCDDDVRGLLREYFIENFFFFFREIVCYIYNWLQVCGFQNFVDVVKDFGENYVG